MSESDPVFVPSADRKCTDVLFLLLFLLFWAGMAAIAIVAFTQVGRRGAGSPVPSLAGWCVHARVRVGF